MKYVKRFYYEKMNFLQFHFLYIVFAILITSALFYSQPNTHWNFIDALFMATSSVTNTGLNTIDMSHLSHWQLTIMYVASSAGSHIIVSVIILLVRRHYFSKRFEDVLIFNKAQRLKESNRRNFEKSLSNDHLHKKQPLKKRLSFRSLRSSPTENQDNHSLSSFLGTRIHVTRPLSVLSRTNGWLNIGCNDDDLPPRIDNSPFTPPLEDLARFKCHRKNSSWSLPSLSSSSSMMQRSVSEHTLTDSDTKLDRGIAFADNIEQQRENARIQLEQDRKFEEILLNSEKPQSSLDRFIYEPIDKSQLTREERYRLGGVEYRAIDFLTRLVPIYYIFFVLGFGLVIRLYVSISSYAQEVLLTANSNGKVDPWIFSFFTSLSSFNNLGLLPVDANMVPFQSAPSFLIANILLILAGNTAYAIFLRWIIWTLYKLTPDEYVLRKETFRYLLDHPRRCYTTLFPATQTWWLFLVLIAITVIEFISFIALNYWLPVLEGISWGARLMDGLFQSVATRSAGSSIVDLMNLNPGTQIVFIAAMYISVYPVTISMRNSNVYQERALGIYRDEEYDDNYEPPLRVQSLKRHSTITSIMTASKKILRKPDFYVMTQIRQQLTSEICWVIFCIFIICVVESEEIMSSSPISMSTVIYECVSAFGNVGSSTSFPNTTTSQSGQYHLISKLVLILLMTIGRHRGLPSAIDRAVLLPSDQFEEELLEIKL